MILHIAILREHLVENGPVSEVRKTHGICVVNFYNWQKSSSRKGRALRAKAKCLQQPSSEGGGCFVPPKRFHDLTRERHGIDREPTNIESFVGKSGLWFQRSASNRICRVHWIHRQSHRIPVTQQLIACLPICSARRFRDLIREPHGIDREPINIEWFVGKSALWHQRSFRVRVRVRVPLH